MNSLFFLQFLTKFFIIITHLTSSVLGNLKNKEYRIHYRINKKTDEIESDERVTSLHVMHAPLQYTEMNNGFIIVHSVRVKPTVTLMNILK